MNERHQNEYQCEKTSCGCSTTKAARCRCGESCACQPACRCGDCGCAKTK
jgi:hypothetical protein